MAARSRAVTVRSFLVALRLLMGRERSLLDRLDDPRPNAPRRVEESTEDLADSVLVHLQRMLNTRQGNCLTLEDYGEAQSYLRKGLAVAARDDTALSTVPDLSSVEDLSQALRTCSTAKTYFDEALDLALNMQSGTRVLEPLIQLAHALVEQDTV